MEDLVRAINEIKEQVTVLAGLLKIDQKRQVISQLQMEMSQGNFWQNQEIANKTVSQLKLAKSDVDDWDGLNKRCQEISELLELNDAALSGDLSKEITQLQKDLEQLHTNTLFCEKFDDSGAIVEINAGAGGTESCDWASMLYRMYTRWAEDKKFTLTLLEELRGEEAGIKNVTFFVDGLRAYGLLKSERGVHRLVRISPFDANKRRHTSFASVSILPQVENQALAQIKSEDLRIDTFRASGAGGQHVNRTDSAVRLTHLPTGIVVGSQNDRSQHQNKQNALRLLAAKLFELEEQRKQKELESIGGKKQKIEWGSQIRSYVLHPYLMVKDHRTDIESHDAWGVLDGKLDEFTYGYLKQRRA